LTANAMPPYIIKEYSQETWPDFEALFGKHKGVRGGCWCTFNLCTSSEFDRMTRDERKAFQKRVADRGPGAGLILYDNDVPIAWCQFGRADLFPRFDRGRAYKELPPVDRAALWRISCLFVDKHRRREGLSHVTLKAALATIGRHGGGVVEAFPLDVPGAKYPSYTGSVIMYAAEGFEIVAPLGKNAYLMRRTIPANSGAQT
jgi:hypothetical protein